MKINTISNILPSDCFFNCKMFFYRYVLDSGITGPICTDLDNNPGTGKSAKNTNIASSPKRQKYEKEGGVKKVSTLSFRCEMHPIHREFVVPSTLNSRDRQTGN